MVPANGTTPGRVVQAGRRRRQPARSSNPEEGIMNHSTRVLHRPRRAWPATARIAAAGITTAGLALLTACGGSPDSHVAHLSPTATRSSPASPGSGGSSNEGGSTNSQSPNSQLLAYAHCMGSHGEPNFPDPNSSGQLPKNQIAALGPSTPRFLAAQTACRHMLPNGGSGPTQAQVQQLSAQALKFAQCMRSHGVTTFPDPDSTGRIPDPATFRIDQGSPQFQAANQACRKYRPGYFPSNAAYNSWTRTQGS
jgi:hypothetical protein